MVKRQTRPMGRGFTTKKKPDTGIGSGPEQTVNAWRIGPGGKAVKVGPWSRAAKGGTVKRKK